MKPDPSVTLGLRRALTSLRAHAGAVGRALDAISEEVTIEARRATAMEAGMAFPALANAGELVSRPTEERDAMILAATDSLEEREHALALAVRLAEPRVFRALRHVLPSSYRSPTLEAWERYRAHLKGLLDRPVWPGRAATLRQLYVAPDCIDLSEVSDWAAEEMGDLHSVATRSGLPTHKDPLPLLLGKLGIARSPVLVGGDAGSGKTTVALVLADTLARNDDVFPIFIDARSMSSGRPLAKSIQEAPLDRGFPDLLDDDRWVTAPTLIIDGVPDPQPMKELTALIETGHVAGAVVTVGLDQRLYDGFPLFKGIALRPFDEGHARTWASRWNATTGATFAVDPFLHHDDSTAAADDSLPDLQFSRQPLTLLLIAEMAAEGHTLRGTSTPRDRAELYCELITWRCGRFGQSSLQGEFRSRLREAARFVHEQRTKPIHDWYTEEGAVDEYPFRLWSMDRGGGDATNPFPLVDSDRGLRFFHDSFADYLLAESLAVECARITSRTPDIDGTLSFALEPGEITARWLRTFATFELTIGVERFLSVMLRAWSRFAKGSQNTSRRFQEVWMKASALVYRELVDDRSFAHAFGALNAPDLSPEVARARGLYAVLLLASSGRSPADRFAPEKAEERSFPKVARLLGREPRPHLYGRISLANTNWVGEPLQGIDLAYHDLRDSQLRRASLDGAFLIWCNLSRTDLRLARLCGTSLDRTTLDAADLRGARLDGATLSGATLKNTLLIGASLHGVDLSETQRAEAIFTHEEANARGVALRDLPNDDHLPF